MRVGSGSETSERAKNTRSGGSYEIERTKLKISMVTSIGDSTSCSYPASDRLRVERESFDGLVQIYPLVGFHKF